jgi:hypothetical protein
LSARHNLNPRRQKQASTRPHAGLANFQLWPQNLAHIGVIERGRTMRAQRAWYPVESDYGAMRLHPALKHAPTLYFPDFRKQAIEQKVRFQDFTRFARSEFGHLRDFMWEWVCVSFQI